MPVDLTADSNAAFLDDRMRGFGCAGMKRRVETFLVRLSEEEMCFPGLHCIGSAQKAMKVSEDRFLFFFLALHSEVKERVARAAVLSPHFAPLCTIWARKAERQDRETLHSVGVLSFQGGVVS